MPKARAAQRERGSWRFGTRIAIDLRGAEPVAKGSMKAFNIPGKRFPVVTDAKTPELKAYERDVRTIAAAEMDRLALPCAVDQPFEVLIVYYLPRPGGDWNASHELKPSARTEPWVKPDLDKLERATLDALTGMVWDDDARVCRVVKEKRYATRERDIGVWIEARVRPATIREAAAWAQLAL